MRCASCTTELWGNPEVCPVCGSPTGLIAPRGRRSRDPHPDASEALSPPQGQPPLYGSGLLNLAESGGAQAPQGGSLFNAADLIDPQILKALPLPDPEPGAGAVNTAAPAAQGNTGAPQQQPMINAADLFDPALLAELEGGRVESPPADDRQQDNWLLGTSPPELPPPAPHAGQRPPRQSNGPAAPFLSLPPLAVPPAPSRPSAPMRHHPPPQVADAARIANVPALPEETEEPTGRGWNIVSPGLPADRPRSRPSPQGPSGYAPVPYPPTPYPQMPVPQAPPRRGQTPPEPHHGLLATLGGWLSLLLVLSIISVAILFAAIRYFQLQDSQTVGAQSPGALPTVAPRPGYMIYRDTILGFSVQVPNTWVEKAVSDKSDPQFRGDSFKISSDSYFVIASSSQFQSWSAGQIDDDILNNGHGSSLADTDLSNITVSSITTSAPTASTIPIAGLNWTPEDATVTYSNGLTLKMTSLAVNYNGRGYAIFYFATPQVFDSYNSQYFEPALLTFRLLNTGQ